ARRRSRSRGERIMAAADFHLKIDGIEGESAHAKHKNEIDLESWSWGETQSGTFAVGGGGGAGKGSMKDFRFVAGTGKASPKLFLAWASGQHISSAILTCRKAGGEQEGFLKYTLTDILVSFFQSGGQGFTLPTDWFDLNFAKVEIEYKEQTKS